MVPRFIPEIYLRTSSKWISLENTVEHEPISCAKARFRVSLICRSVQPRRRAQSCSE